LFGENVSFASLIPPSCSNGPFFMWWLLILIHSVNGLASRGPLTLQFVPAYSSVGSRRLIPPRCHRAGPMLGWGRLLWRLRVQPPVDASRFAKNPVDKFQTTRPRTPAMFGCCSGWERRYVDGRPDSDEAGMH
jgi:hypothetical protein